MAKKLTQHPHGGVCDEIVDTNIKIWRNTITDHYFSVYCTLVTKKLRPQFIKGSYFLGSHPTFELKMDKFQENGLHEAIFGS